MQRTAGARAYGGLGRIDEKECGEALANRGTARKSSMTVDCADVIVTGIGQAERIAHDLVDSIPPRTFKL
jgi:hypothetical protein